MTIFYFFTVNPKKVTIEAEQGEKVFVNRSIPSTNHPGFDSNNRPSFGNPFAEKQTNALFNTGK